MFLCGVAAEGEKAFVSWRDLILYLRLRVT